MYVVFKQKNVGMPKLNFLKGHRPLECTLIINKEVLPDVGPGPEWVCLGPAGSVWVLDFV